MKQVIKLGTSELSEHGGGLIIKAPNRWLAQYGLKINDPIFSVLALDDTIRFHLTEMPGSTRVKLRHINGGSWITTITSPATSGVTASLSVSDTVEVQTVGSGTPDGNFVDIVDPLAARERLEMQLGLIEALGVTATGEVGDGDPLVAIESALKPEPASGLVLSTLPPGSCRWHRSKVTHGMARRIRVPYVIVYDDATDPAP